MPLITPDLRGPGRLMLDDGLPADLTDRGVTPADLAADRPGLGGELLPGH